MGFPAVFPIKFSSYSQGPKMAVLVLMLNFRWDGLNFSRPPQSRGPPEAGEEFLKFCLHSDMGLSRALSSVLILIGASCPWLGLRFYCNVGLSRTLSCKLLFFFL